MFGANAQTRVSVICIGSIDCHDCITWTAVDPEKKVDSRVCNWKKLQISRLILLMSQKIVAQKLNGIVFKFLIILYVLRVEKSALTNLKGLIRLKLDIT